MDRASALLHRGLEELGLSVVLSATRDVKILLLQRFVRNIASGAAILILVQFFGELGTSDAQIGLFMTLTLLGDVLVSFILTLIADGIGRRKILLGGSAFVMIGGIVFATCSSFWLLLPAAVLGVISPSSREIGPFKAVEESIVSQLCSKEDRSFMFAWQNMFGLGGAAIGLLLTGWIVSALIASGWTALGTYRLVFVVYAIIGVAKFVLSLMLSPACESIPEKIVLPTTNDTELAEGLLDEDGEEGESNAIKDVEHSRPEPAIRTQPHPRSKLANTLRSLLPAISPESISIVVKLCALFILDSFGGGMAPISWLTAFFIQKFSVPESSLGTLFFITQLLGAITSLFAANLANRIGLVKTMIFTHLPSSVFLALIPLPSNMYLAMALLVLRSLTSSMDQAPRQAFLAGAVLNHERTAVMGVVNVVKTMANSGGIGVTGVLAEQNLFWLMFVLAGGMKIAYDLGLLYMFTGFKERA